MRHLLVGIVAIALFVPYITGQDPHPAVAASVDRWPTSLVEEQLLADFQANATAAGALGFYRDEATSALVVLVPESRSAAYAGAKLGSAPIPVTVKISEIDPMALEVAFERLRAVAREHISGSDTMAMFFDPQLGMIQVETSLDEATVLNSLGASREVVAYRHDGPKPNGRFDDFAPFWGGAAIDIKDWGAPEFDCTTGFSVINGSGAKAIVTAAHCGAAGHTVITPSFDRVVGTVNPMYCQDDNADVELIKGKTYDNWIYTGMVANPNIPAEVTQYGTPAVGSKYNVSGAATFEHDNQLVLKIDGELWREICDDTGYVKDLIVYTHRVNGVDTCQTDVGDSGAPFYFKWNPGPTVGIRGMHLYGSGTKCYAILHSKISSVTGYNALTN